MQQQATQEAQQLQVAEQVAQVGHAWQEGCLSPQHLHLLAADATACVAAAAAAIATGGLLPAYSCSLFTLNMAPAPVASCCIAAAGMMVLPLSGQCPLYCCCHVRGATSAWLHLDYGCSSSH